MQYRRRRRIATSSGSSNTGQMMSLALFIMLLAFFIVLNAISSYEVKKSEKVKQSIREVFSNDVMQTSDSPSATPDEANSVNEGDTFERLDALFQAQVISFKATKSKAKGIMMVTVPYDEFAQAMHALNQQDLTRNPNRLETRKNFFLPTLVSLLRTHIDGNPTRLEIYLHVKDNPAKMQNQNPRELKSVIDNVGEYSALLQKKGLPEKLLNIGIAEGDPKFVHLVFRKYRPFSPVKNTVEGK